MNQEERKGPAVPKVDSVRFIQRSNGIIKGYAVNTFHGLVKNYNEDRVSIIMNITKPNFKGRWPRCSYFGVFDGHGGNKCSDFLKENMHKYITENSHFPHEPIQALKFGFKKAEQQFLAFAEAQNPVQRSGSCAIVLLIIDQICYIANVGDSRAILSANSGKNVYAISKDHKPDSETERQRIFNAGGRIYQSSIKNKNGNTVLGPFRIQPGKLSVSRAFGDIEAKLAKYDGNNKVLIAKPEITYFQISNEQHDFIMMCSDGVYDKLANEEVAQCFWETKDNNIDQKQKYGFIGNVPSKVIQRSMEKMSMDNLTSLIIVFQDHGRLMLPSKKNIRNSQKQSARRMPSTSEQENQNRRKNSNFNRMRQSTGKQEGIIEYTSKVDQNLQQYDPNRENSKQNRDNNRESNEESRKQISDKISKRKSSSNIFAAGNEKKTDLPHSSQSLSNSISAKMIMAGSKAFQKTKLKQSNDKVNIGQLLNKKRSVDVIKKQKQALWKQMTHKNGDMKEKLIRF